MLRKITKFIGMAAFTSLVFSGIANAEPIVIKFSHVVAKDTPKGMAAELFKERAEALTHGKVRIDIYPNSQLYKDKEELEALQLGSVDMLAPSLAKFGPLGVTAFEVFDLSYIFKDYEAVHKVTNGPVGRKLLDKLEEKGIYGLSYWDNGFKSFSANTPISKPEDLKGKKMRIQSSKVLDAQMRAIKTNPQVIPFADVYSSLQNGVVDGTENPISNFYTQKMHEVQKYLTITDHGYLGYAVIVNKKFWDSLPQDVRNSLNLAMEEATVYANKIAAEMNQKDLERVRESGKTTVTVLTQAQREAFRKLLVPVHDAMKSRIGEETVEAVYKAVGFKK